MVAVSAPSASRRTLRQIEVEGNVAAFMLTDGLAIAPSLGEKIRRVDNGVAIDSVGE